MAHPFRKIATPTNNNGEKPMNEPVIPEGYELITPERARALIDGHVNYRDYSPGHAAKIAADLLAGRWNPQASGSVKIDENNHLCDGHHRCQGVLISGVPMLVRVEYGFPVSAIPFIDTGVRPRTAGDVLRNESMQSYKHVASAARLILRWTSPQGVVGRDTVSSPEIVEFSLKHRDDMDVVVAAGSRAGRAIGSPFAPLAAFHFLARQVDEDTADRFMELLSSGANLAEDDPILALRNWNINKSTNRIKVSTEERCFAISKAWNTWREGRPMKLMKVVLSGRGEARQQIPTLI